jgi:2-polyprenyl-3-methyl-5-hydroxy-6-metoxy-1,4-benzoquinol methylase
MDLIESRNQRTRHRHPWELSRAESVLSYADRQSISNVVDVGAGDRFVVEQIKRRVTGRVYAVDSGYTAKRSVLKGVCCLNDIGQLPRLTAGNNLVLMMDILEHVKDDAGFLRQALKNIPDGKVIITVPAWQMLFSERDKAVKHYRRYNRKQLIAVIKKADLEIIRIHYFYASLTPLRLIQKTSNKLSKAIPVRFGVTEWRYPENHFATELVRGALNWDFKICRALAKIHVYLPGLSLVAICRKK